MNLTLPHNYTPRDYQLPFWKAFDSGNYNRFIQVWHRRSGKDRTDLNLCAREMLKVVGAYYYLFPTYTQGKKALWEGIGSDGFRYIKHFPEQLLDGKPNETEMKIRYKNGSLFQIIGSDEIDRVMGTNPRGVVFSEYSLQVPKAWDYIRPILRENKGWAVFNYTPRGKNHGFDLYEMAKNNPKWYTSLLTIEETNVLTKQDIQEEIEAGMTQDMVQQEFFCSFVAAIQGSYYWQQYDEAERAGRFENVPFDSSLPVHTVWDLGISDAMAIGFYQVVGQEIHKIDYYENVGQGLPHYAQILQQKATDEGYVYGKHFAPHDIKARELATGLTRLESAANLGIDFEVVPDIGVQNGIDLARKLFKRLWVDKTRCKEWLKIIPLYTKDYDEEKKIFRDKPRHDYTSHGADEFRYAAVIIDQMIGTSSANSSSIYIPVDNLIA